LYNIPYGSTFLFLIVAPFVRFHSWVLPFISDQ
jgi:hypothetical protein